MTIYDIAKLAGVSASTVSRVINGKSGVGDQKRKQIEELLKQYNYAPDENARGLVTQSSRTVGILTDDLFSRRQNEGTAKLEGEIMRGGYFCFTKYIGTGPSAVEDGIADLAGRRVEGALLLGNAFRDHKKVERAVRKYLPNTPVFLVHQTSRPELSNVYCVGADESKGIRRCVELLASRGRRCLAVLVDKGRASEKLICESFEKQIKKVPELQGWVYTGVEPNVDSGIEQTKRILREHPDIDGLLCVQDGIAIGAIYGLQSMGIRVPQDVSIIGEDNSILCEACRPRLTSMDTMVGLTTIMSARMLLDVLNGREQPHCIILENEIVERETL